MFQKVYMPDGDKRSRLVSVKTGETDIESARNLRTKAIRCAKEWRSRIVMCRARKGDPALVPMEGAPSMHLMVRLCDAELGERKPRKVRKSAPPYKMEYRDRN